MNKQLFSILALLLGATSLSPQTAKISEILKSIKEDFSINDGTIDNTTSSTVVALKLLNNQDTSTAFHYLRELKNTLKLGDRVCSSSFCTIIKEAVMVWKNNFQQQARLPLVCGMSTQALGDVLFGITLENHQLLKKDPDTFFQKLLPAKTIERLNADEIETTAKDLGVEIYNLTELLLNKIHWNIDQQEELWSQVWEIASQISDIASYGIIDRDDQYSDLWQSLKSRVLLFLNHTSTKSESGKNGYLLHNSFFQQGQSFLKNELSFCPEISWLETELNNWSAKREITTPKDSGKSKTKGRIK